VFQGLEKAIPSVEKTVLELRVSDPAWKLTLKSVECRGHSGMLHKIAGQLFQQLQSHQYSTEAFQKLSNTINTYKKMVAAAFDIRAKSVPKHVD
jgi:hypothetical protein